MLRNISRYIIVILVICLFFRTSVAIKNNIDDRHPDIEEISYSVDSANGYVDSIVIANDLTVIPDGMSKNAELFDDCYYALMINDTSNTVYAAKNVHSRMYPASMTKLMTAIIVCDKIESGEISLDDVVTVSKNYDLTYEGVAPCTIKSGSKITIKNLLYGLLIHSDNYYALILADYIGGDEATFCSLMNTKAYSIGATNTHYANPHGLDNREHYTTAYDTYLIIKEAYSHDLIREIDSNKTYSYSYINSAGYETDVDITPTNLFLTDSVNLPASYNIKVWKTGTTTGAGYCLAMYLEKDNEYYVAIAASGSSKSSLYDSMVKLLCLKE
ncbi:MAG: D-alanyl-D-alanine carboxypeptidase family protein [Wujia sp.]